MMQPGLKRVSAIIIQYVRRRHNWLSLILFILILIVFRYASLADSPPQSTHLWRQSDCTSLALNYYQDGMRFFKPEIHNLHADRGTSGHSISECPVLYYSVAGLYHLFGRHHMVYRGLWSVILLAGFFCLYRFSYLLTGSKFYSLAGSLLIAGSPVIIFYGNSFLPDVPAFAFVLTGWMFFAKWMTGRRSAYLYLTALFFMFGGVMKVTSLISFFSLAGIWFIELSGLRLSKDPEGVFPGKWRSALPFLIAFTAVAGWYLWAWRFNRLHDTQYFSMRTCPIWNLSSCTNSSFADVIRQLGEIWMPHLLSIPMRVFLVSCLLFILVFIRKANRMLLVITALTFTGSLLFILVWFAAFHDHDYYFINLYIFPVFLLVTSIDLAVRHFREILYSTSLMMIIGGLTLYGIYYTGGKQKLRYDGWMNYEYRQFADIRAVAPLIDRLGISPDDLVVSIPDRTSSYTLYLLNRKGWTLFYDQAGDSAALARCIEKGARFLFITGYPESIGQYPYLKHFTEHPVGIYNKLQIFRIDGRQHNRELVQVVDTLYRYALPAGEPVEPGSPWPEPGKPGRPGGENSPGIGGDNIPGRGLLLNKDNQFGFTTVVPVYPNSTLTAVVRKKSDSGSGMLVISSKNPERFYHSDGGRGIAPVNGWGEGRITVDFGGRPGHDELMVYVWNPEDEHVCFDSLEILVTRHIPEVRTMGRSD